MKLAFSSGEGVSRRLTDEEVKFFELFKYSKNIQNYTVIASC